jgi:hypothetical protein
MEICIYANVTFIFVTSFPSRTLLALGKYRVPSAQIAIGYGSSAAEATCYWPTFEAGFLTLPSLTEKAAFELTPQF